MNQKVPQKCSTFGLWDTEWPWLQTVMWGTNSCECHHFQAVLHTVTTWKPKSVCEGKNSQKKLLSGGQNCCFVGHKACTFLAPRKWSIITQLTVMIKQIHGEGRREDKTRLSSHSSHPQPHSPSSGSWLSSSIRSLLPLTQREQNLWQRWSHIMQTTLLIFKNKHKRKSMLIWPGTWLSPLVLLLFPS